MSFRTYDIRHIYFGVLLMKTNTKRYNIGLLDTYVGAGALALWVTCGDVIFNGIAFVIPVIHNMMKDASMMMFVPGAFVWTIFVVARIRHQTRLLRWVRVIAGFCVLGVAATPVANLICKTHLIFATINNMDSLETGRIVLNIFIVILILTTKIIVWWWLLFWAAPDLLRLTIEKENGETSGLPPLV